MKEEIKKSYFIAKKDMGAYYLKPPLISWGLMLPIVFVFAFYFRNPMGIKEVVPGLIGLTLLFSCTSMAAIVITFEKRIGALERLLLAPLNFRTILLGKTLGSTLFGLMVAIVITLILIPLMGLHVKHFWAFVLIFIFSGLAFSLLGILISVGVKEVFEAMTMSNFFRFPYDLSLRGLLSGSLHALPSSHSFLSSSIDLYGRWPKALFAGGNADDAFVS